MRTLLFIICLGLSEALKKSISHSNLCLAGMCSLSRFILPLIALHPQDPLILSLVLSRTNIPTLVVHNNGVIDFEIAELQPHQTQHAHCNQHALS